MITPRRTRLVRVPDLQAFRAAIVELSLAHGICPPRRTGSHRRRGASVAAYLWQPAGAGTPDARAVLRRASSMPGHTTPTADGLRPRRHGAGGSTRSLEYAGPERGSPPRPHRRDSALLRPAPTPGEERRSFRGTARRGAVEGFGARSRRRAHARAGAVSGGDVSRLRTACRGLGRMRRAHACASG